MWIARQSQAEPRSQPPTINNHSHCPCFPDTEDVDQILMPLDEPSQERVWLREH